MFLSFLSFCSLSFIVTHSPDFGLSKIINSREFKMTELCGTSEYVAPEVLKGKCKFRTK